MMSKPSFAIVGGTTLLGKELREVFEALPKAVDVRLIGAEKGEIAGLTAEGDEPVVVSPLDDTSLMGATVVFLAGGSKSSERVWEMLAMRKKRPFVVDLSGVLARVPKAQLRAPLVEAPGFEVISDSVQVIAHPASVALAILLRKLGDGPRVGAVSAHVFVPASDQGSAGIDELHHQTVNLLGFQNMPKAVFDDQVAFNVLPSWGADAAAGSLSAVEDTIRKELPRMLPNQSLPPVSVRCIQPGVFHCISISLHLQFAKPFAGESLAEALRGDLVDLWSMDQGVPSHLSAVGETGIVVGDIRPDASAANAFWMWIVADNLRLRAASAIAAARIWLS
ncbi:MAG: hypothetical protein KIT83_03930 [Bryobacterales bacterium]|nr:hypothetical protein [Bryobacterales bacterium]